MSEAKEKKKRYNQKLQFAAALEKWAEEEPAKWKLIAWVKWVRRMPKMEDFVKQFTVADFEEAEKEVFRVFENKGPQRRKQKNENRK